MNSSLKNIIDLSNLDKNSASCEEQKEILKTKLNGLLVTKDEILKKAQNVDEKIQNASLNIRKNNSYLQELNEKLIDNSKKTAKVKTEKEAKALSLEEDIAKEQITFANDEIKRYEKIIENSKEENEEAKKELEDIEEEIAKEEEVVDKEMKSIDRGAKKIERSKTKLIKEIDEKAILFYNRIKKWAGNVSVVPVVDQICYGCYIQLNDQAYIDILKQEEIKTCPHCGRILYLDPNMEAVAN